MDKPARNIVHFECEICQHQEQSAIAMGRHIKKEHPEISREKFVIKVIAYIFVPRDKEDA
jgi:hypothetical protein